VLGALRVGFLEPALGALLSVAVELPVMLGIAWWLAGRLCRRFGVEALPARVVMGELAFALLIAAEFALAVLAFGMAPGAVMAHWATPAGALGLAGQVAFGTFPLLRGMLGAR
jgi:hypothetical protein